MPDLTENNTADYEISRKIYYIVLSFSLLWLMLIFLAPLLSHLGGVFENISSFLYLFFSKVCHQQDERSFHLFDHKLGVCSRCVWIYAGFFCGTALYSLKYKLDNTQPPSMWILISAVILMLLDVVLDLTGIMQNSFYSRSVTGFLMGIVLPLYIIPGFVKFFNEVFSFLRNKVST